MIQMTVGDFKAHFSSVLEKVLQGEEIQVLYGRSKKPVAKFSKITENPNKKRPLGLYKDYGPFWEDENYKLTPEVIFDNMDDLL